jgi:hypothetical protein
MLQTEDWWGLGAEEEAHPMGELEFEQKALVKAVDQALLDQVREGIELRLTTPGGRFHVRWDEGGSATALGQLAFFAEFLEVLLTPPAVSSRYISPSEAFLPPTRGTSSMLN